MTLQKYTIEFEDDWDNNIPAALFAYRTMQNNTTRHEPFFLTYGRETRLPIELQYKTYQETEENFDQQLLQ
jgi:hypothetical protein